MTQDTLQSIINAMTKSQMTSYTAGPIYSSFVFRVNSTLINLVSRFVTFPDGTGIEHETWEESIPADVKEQVHNWLGVRNNIVDAINELDGGYPPASIEDTYNYLLQSASNVDQNQLMQSFALDYVRRQSAGEKMHSTIQQYVEDHVATTLRSNSMLADTKDQVLSYLSKEDLEKSKDASATSYCNLPEWFEEVIATVFEAKFTDAYNKKLVLLDRRLSPNTRQAIETEVFLMEDVAKEIGIKLKHDKKSDFDQNAYLASLGLVSSAV